MICLRSGLRFTFIYPVALMWLLYSGEIYRNHTPPFFVLWLFWSHYLYGCSSTGLSYQWGSCHIVQNILLFSTPYLTVAISRHFSRGHEVKSPPSCSCFVLTKSKTILLNMIVVHIRLTYSRCYKKYARSGVKCFFPFKTNTFEVKILLMEFHHFLHSLIIVNMDGWSRESSSSEVKWPYFSYSWFFNFSNTRHFYFDSFPSLHVRGWGRERLQTLDVLIFFTWAWTSCSLWL